MRRALFLDRDGTINVNYGYVYEPERFDFVEGIFDLCLAAKGRGYAIIVASNQSGVARGYYTREQMDACNAYMSGEFARRGIEIADVFCCTALDDADPDRKPNPGMFLKAIAKHGIDAAASVAVGDGERDCIAAARAGVGTVAWLREGARGASAAAPGGDGGFIEVGSLADVVPLLAKGGC